MTLVHLKLRASLLELKFSILPAIKLFGKLFARPVARNATLFDKLPSDNWLVPRHQDVNIAVAERHELPGFGAWSMKSGVHHVQPPVAALEKMIAGRLRLDPEDETNGVLRVLTGGHNWH